MQEAVASVTNNGWAEDLRRCPTLTERYQELLRLLPEILEWEIPLARNQLFYHIQRSLEVDLGVCEFYQVDNDDDHHQYCTYGGGKEECTGMIPQIRCVIRDKAGKSKYPDSLQYFQKYLWCAAP